MDNSSLKLGMFGDDESVSVNVCMDAAGGSNWLLWIIHRKTSLATPVSMSMVPQMTRDRWKLRLNQVSLSVQCKQWLGKFEYATVSRDQIMTVDWISLKSACISLASLTAVKISSNVPNKMFL